MTEIVVLSDSNESVLSVDEPKVIHKDVIKARKSRKPMAGDSDASDFEFPEVNFYHVVDEDKTNELQRNIDNENSPNNLSPCPSLYRASSLTTEDILKQHKLKRSSEKSSENPSDRGADVDEAIGNPRTQKRNKVTGKKNRDQLIEERLKRQEQLARERALKTIALKKSKNIKPGECMKFVEVVLDKGIENFAFISDIVNTLLDANLQYSINTELVSNSITWKRNIEHNYVNESNEVCTETVIETVNRILVIWNWDEAVTNVANSNCTASISNIKSLLPDYTVILVIFGIEDYFNSKKQGKQHSNRTKNKGQKASNKNTEQFNNFPEISRRQLEVQLNEIQIVCGCSSKIINAPTDLALMVYQCTKAIAEIPHKVEKSKNLTSKFDWYVMGDNRNTVKVDRNGNGLKRLWQQQLCQFSLSSLEIAEAICSVYPSPVDLMEAYSNCTDQEGINLLKNIPIRRAAGPLTTVRKVGPELSKKIYLMFMSRDGETVLS